MAKKLRIIFEVKGLPQAVAYQSLTAASHKLPGKYKVIEKNREENLEA